MTTTQTNIRNNNYDSYAKIDFTTDYVDSEIDVDFSEFSLLLAKTNDTLISCDACSASFNITTPFYTIDSSVAFCASHLPTALLDEINIL
jgi:hypothetical protein